MTQEKTFLLLTIFCEDQTKTPLTKYFKKRDSKITDSVEISNTLVFGGEDRLRG